MNTKRLLILQTLVAFFFSSCIYDTMTWSPDGRYLAYIAPGDNQLWLWDNLRGESRLLTGQQTVNCRFVPTGQEVVFGVHQSDEKYNYFRVNIHSNEIQPIASNIGLHYELSADGRYFYFIRDNDGENTTEIRKMELTQFADENRDPSELIYSHAQPDDLFFFSLDPSETQILLTKGENEIVWYRMSNKQTKTAVSNPDAQLAWPQWIDDNIFTYLVFNNDKDGTLYRQSLSEPASPTVLHTKALISDIPSIDRKNGRVYLTTETDIEDQLQAVSVDLKTNAIHVIADHPLGAGITAVSPDGNWLSYLEQTLDEFEKSAIQVREISSTKTGMVWKNTEERLLASADQLYHSGQFKLAQELYRDFLARFPTSRFKEYAWYQLLAIDLATPETNLDQSFEALNQIRNAYMLPAHTLFWSKTERAATDPAEDWITRFGTDKSKETFGFDTDLTRDLLGLSVHYSKDRLYLKIDYNSSRDLSGLTFQDTQILLDYDTPSEGGQSLNEMGTIATQLRTQIYGCKWERRYERQIVLYHWYENGEDSQYNIAVLNEQEWPVFKYQATGIGQMNSSMIDVIPLITGETGSVILSISRDLLDLKPNTHVYVQVLTTKGGIEGIQGTELFSLLPNNAVAFKPEFSNIADTFGTMQIDKNKGAIIQGSAAAIEIR